MIVINLFGGPGAGKSTGASYIFSHLKMAGVNCELVNEFAKQAVWEGRQKVFTDQLYIFAKQHHRLHIIKDEVDVAICDSPLLLNMIYGHVNCDCPQCFYDLVEHTVAQYENRNWFIDRIKPYNPTGRLQTEAESDRIASEVFSLLYRNAYPKCQSVPGGIAGYDRIIQSTLEELNHANL